MLRVLQQAVSVEYESSALIDSQKELCRRAGDVSPLLERFSANNQGLVPPARRPSSAGQLPWREAPVELQGPIRSVLCLGCEVASMLPQRER